MASLANGVMRVPVWSDDGEIKPVVNDSGYIPVSLETATGTYDVNLKSSDITLNVNIIQGSGNIPIVINDCILTLPVHLKGSDITLGVQLKGSDITLNVAEQSPLSSIQAQGYGWDGSNWRKLPIVWGYSDRWAQRVYVENATAGTNNLNTTDVPAGEVWVLQAMASKNENKDVAMDYTAVFNGTQVKLKVHSLPGVNTWVTLFPIGICLKEGDNARCRFLSCNLNDDLYLDVWGYKMKVAE